ncbi:MAG TPA: helix-turn-helix domain-containing protein [Methanoregulaceae archaeon]|nr:hypothetical protein [Methanolinea sp.]HOP67821.1 helix-turn-helix domain-containing protein [Methanoregulaceae archaeon]HPJ75035.1 helix-turn-helix domain-containing protein [Methanoregulaceae archaeon]HPQ75847.1 helix-turn-helix domain-containing protein [Methanoregulaceae archaeon]HRX34044.1 helix-turn-helix domain-containing protein [Methanoregulaceae archaeon]
MENISPALVSSLNTLGLTNDEARVFATLILFDHAEAKEIVEYLSLSKPSVYTALRHLDSRGLAVKQYSKPLKYRAISPETALSILMRDHEKASELALLELKKLEKKHIRSDMEEPLWTIYGDANIEQKIQDLFRKAKRHISIILGERYIPVLDHITVRDIPFRLIILSSSPGLEEEFRKKFPGKLTEIHVIPLERLKTPPQRIDLPEIKEAWKYFNFENILNLNIDSEEILLGAAFFSKGASVLNTRNKGALVHMEVLNQLFWNRVIGVKGEDLEVPQV